MAKRPFQFSALVLQKELAKGSFLVNPLQANRLISNPFQPQHDIT